MTSTSGERKRRIPMCVYVACFLVAVLALPWVGGEHLSWTRVLAFVKGEGTAEGLIFFHQRIPRVLLALAVGGSLCVTGAALQVLFRNPLAEPWTLGVSGGAAIGAFAAQAFDTLDVAVGPLTSAQALALCGAGAVMVLIVVFSRRLGAVSAQTLLLAGVTISVMSGSLIMLVTYFITPFRFMSFHRWMMGGLDVIGYGDLWTFVVLGVPGLVMLACQAREYNHLALGEDTALGHGVDVVRVQRWTFVGAGLATAACVTMAGPIGFIGMIVPHMVRRLSGFDNRVVLAASFLAGGVILALCDGLARTVIAPTEVPVGIMTAVFGGPVFLYLLMRR